MEANILQIRLGPANWRVPKSGLYLLLLFLTVPVRDVEALKEKILLLYEHPELREAMSRRARARAEEFTWAAYQRRVAQLFGGLLSADA